MTTTHTVEALLELVNEALAAGESGEAGADESLGAAEIYARLAAGSHAPAAIRHLGKVYLKRRDYAAAAGDVASECLFGALALVRLDQAADAGDDVAAAMVGAATVSREASELACDWGRNGYAATLDAEDAVCAAAANGCEASLDLMLDEALASISTQQRSARAGLALAYTIGRMGATFGLHSITRRLAGVLIWTGAVDREDGNAERGLACERMALVKLFDLLTLKADRTPGDDAEFADTAAQLKMAALLASVERPQILTYLTPMGAC